MQVRDDPMAPEPFVREWKKFKVGLGKYPGPTLQEEQKQCVLHGFKAVGKPLPI